MVEQTGEQATYFGLLAELGHTKHVGGQKATARIMDLIAPSAGDRILDVGCGVGIAAVFMAEQFGSRVVGVDITPQMVARAEERAERHGVTHLTKFRVASMYVLPFEADTFDAALAESVLTFATDKTAVVNEMARVVKPGGMVAFTEAIWVRQPPADKADFMARAAGMPEGILAHEAWAAIVENSVLDETVAEPYEQTAREESKSQMGRVSLGDYLRTTGRFFKVLANPRYRDVFRTAMGSMPQDYFNYVGYGVYGGRVQPLDAR